MSLSQRLSLYRPSISSLPPPEDDLLFTRTPFMQQCLTASLAFCSEGTTEATLVELFEREKMLSRKRQKERESMKNGKKEDFLVKSTNWFFQEEEEERRKREEEKREERKKVKEREEALSLREIKSILSLLNDSLSHFHTLSPSLPLSPSQSNSGQQVAAEVKRNRLTIREMMRGSTLLTSPIETTVRKKSPEFEAFLARAKAKQERREVRMLTLPARALMKGEGVVDGTMGSEYAKSSRDLSQGINILTLMATGFIVFYYVGTMLYQHSKIAPVFTGIFGLVGALLLEVTLLLIREQRKETIQEREKKLAETGGGFSKKDLDVKATRERIKKKEQGMKEWFEQTQAQTQKLSRTLAGDGEELTN